MPLDALIVNAGRLRILTSLAACNPQDFVNLRSTTRLTDGNLAAHARRLESAGLLQIDKSFRQGKPITTFTLTDQGRQRLVHYVNALVASIQPGIGADSADSASHTPLADPALAAPPAPAPIGGDDEWVD